MPFTLWIDDVAHRVRFIIDYHENILITHVNYFKSDPEQLDIICISGVIGIYDKPGVEDNHVLHELCIRSYQQNDDMIETLFVSGRVSHVENCFPSEHSIHMLISINYQKHSILSTWFADQ